MILMLIETRIIYTFWTTHFIYFSYTDSVAWRLFHLLMGNMWNKFVAISDNYF